MSRNTSLRHGGIFTPVFRTRPVGVEYLFLVRQLSGSDLEYVRVEAMLKELKSQGVPLSYYPYRADPRRVLETISGGRTATISLEQLYERHPLARLVLVTEARELVNSFTLQPHTWMRRFDLWPIRALVTPLPRSDWSNVEARIHFDLGYALTSSREGGLDHLGRLFSGLSPYADPESPVSARQSPSFVTSPSLSLVSEQAPSEEECDTLLVELMTHLGARGFSWLGICAHFPAMSPELALHYGRALFADEERHDAFGVTFARLSGLPWMRYGAMPYWARRLIVAALPAEQRAEAQALIAATLDPKYLTGDAPTPTQALSSAPQVAGDARLALPIRIDGEGSGGGLDLDELAIAFLADGSDHDLDPILQLTPQRILQLTAEAKRKTEAAKATTTTRPSVSRPLPNDASAQVDTSQIERAKHESVSDANQLLKRAARKGKSIFIAASHNDSELIDQIKHFLELQGYSSLYIEGVSPDSFRDRIEEELKKAAAVLVVWTRMSINSRWVVSEAEWARENNKLIQTCLRAFDLDSIPIPFRTIETLPITATERLCDALDQFTGVSEEIRGKDSFDTDRTKSTEHTAAASINRTKIRISYRRKDTLWQARAIADALSAAFGRDKVFMDLEIPTGADWREVLKEAATACDVLLVLIGPGWINETDQDTGERRLLNSEDLVRMEIAEALAHDIPVVPLFFDGTTIPDPSLLPDDIKGLCNRHGEHIEHRTFDADVARLIRRLGLDLDDVTNPEGSKAQRSSHPTSSSRDNLISPVLVLKGHTDFVGCATFSPDETLILSGARDKTARVWDATTGGEMARLVHPGEVRSATFSPSGAQIVTGCDDGAIRIWDARGGSLIVKLVSHEGPITTVAFHPDGALIGSASWDGTAKLWNAATGVEKAVLRHKGRVRSLAFSPNGSFIATACDDTRAYLWRTDSGELVRQFAGHTGEVYCVDFSPDGSRIVSASQDTTARVWDVQTGGGIGILSGHTHWVVAARFSGHGRLIVTASDDTSSRTWDAKTFEALATIDGHDGIVNSAVFSHDEKLVLTASHDRTIRVWPLDITLAKRRELSLFRRDGPVGPGTISIVRNGTVKWFNAEKSFGFIQPAEGGADVFVHITALEAAGIRRLLEGTKVTYTLEADRRGKMAAQNIKVVGLPEKQ